MPTSLGTNLTGEPAYEVLVARAAQIGTATWSDAMDELGVANGVCSGLQHRSGYGRCVGFAATARGEVAESGSFAYAEFGLDRMMASVGPAEVLAVDLGGAEISSMGGIGALHAHNLRIAGVLIDGACRDLEVIQSSGLWVASRFVTPRTGKGRVKLGHFGEPIAFAGVTVCKGDLIIGDATGVVVVPRMRMMELLVLAEKMTGVDNLKEIALRTGKTLLQAREASEKR
jgi:regulator of RNase E activity RraA